MNWLIACTILCAVAAHAQTKKPVPVKGLQVPFDIAATNVGSNFKGHDCRQLVAAAKNLKLAKDEFETAQAFDARVREGSGSALYGSLTLGGNIALNGATPSFKYDPENRLLELTSAIIYQKQLVGADLVNWDLMEIVSSKESTYIGSNAFGATTRVRKTDSTVCGAIFLWDRSDRYLIRFPLFDVPPEAARELKDNVSVLYVGKLAPPFFQRIRSASTPTRDWPYETSIEGEGLVMYLNEMWLVNSRTGEVIEKQKH